MRMCQKRASDGTIPSSVVLLKVQASGAGRFLRVIRCDRTNLADSGRSSSRMPRGIQSLTGPQSAPGRMLATLQSPPRGIVALHVGAARASSSRSCSFSTPRTRRARMRARQSIGSPSRILYPAERRILRVASNGPRLSVGTLKRSKLTCNLR